VLLLQGCDACRAVGSGLQSGAALIDVRLDVGSLPPRSSSPTVAGCRLGGFPVGRDWWGGERVVGGVLPRIPKREEPGKTGAPCVKVPGSSRVPPPRSLVRDGQTHPHRPRLVVSHSTCPPLSSFPHAHSFVIGPAVIKHTPNRHWHMGSVCSSMSSSCLQGQVRFGGGVLLFILGSSLGGVGPVRDLRGGGRGGWCEEWARRGYHHLTFSYH
jgi:hypothetical protein